MKKQVLAPTWFHIWFLLSCLFLFAGGIIDGAKVEGVEAFNPAGAAIGMVGMYGIVIALWKFRVRTNWIAWLPVPLAILSVLSGWFFAEIDELVNFPFNPLVPGISLAGDVILTTPMYLGAHLAWYWVLRTYRFTVFQALFTGGLSLGLLELIFGSPSAMVILIFPFLIMIHGVHMVIPKMIFSEQFETFNPKESRMKYILGTLLPATGTGAGILIAFLVASIVLPGGHPSP